MNEKLDQFINNLKSFLNRFTKKQKNIFLSILSLLILLIVVVVSIKSVVHYAPLYSNLSPSETGQIKDTLDSKGIKYKISDNGTTISVPENQVDNLKVDLAAQGIPQTGQIDYSFFGQNASFGITDNEFNVLERASMQTELSNLITSVSGIQSAKVMINLPKDQTFVTDNPGQASVSVVLKLEPGYQLSDTQVQTLYHLISKSIPNLTENNIVIMDDMFNYFEPLNSNQQGNSSALSAYQQQEEVQQNIEKDIEREVQQMLGIMMGADKVMVNVSTNIDFTKEKTEEKLVTPVDPKTNKGIEVSVDNITENYTGTGAAGAVGTGTSDIPEYTGSTTNGNGTYKHVENRVNYEFNHITNEITKSPYQIKDMGIEVMVEPPNPKNPKSLSQQSIKDIKNILDTIVRTTLSNNGGQALTTSAINQRVAVSMEPFNGKDTTVVQPTVQTKIPIWLYVLLGSLTACTLTSFILYLRRRRAQDEPMIQDISVKERKQEINSLMEEMLSQESDSEQRKKQLEKMAKNEPAEFVKLLRTWLAEE